MTISIFEIEKAKNVFARYNKRLM